MFGSQRFGLVSVGGSDIHAPCVCILFFILCIRTSVLGAYALLSVCGVVFCVARGSCLHQPCAFSLCFRTACLSGSLCHVLSCLLCNLTLPVICLLVHLPHLFSFIICLVCSLFIRIVFAILCQIVLFQNVVPECSLSCVSVPCCWSSQVLLPIVFY